MLYANSLEWTEGEITIHSVGKGLNVETVSLLESDEKTVWQQTEAGLKISFPKKKSSDFAHAFKTTSKK